MKIFDIVAPKDDWERNYARMEYRRIAWHDLWNPTTYIDIKTDGVYVCMQCKKVNTDWEYLCQRCGDLAAIAEDESEQEKSEGLFDYER